MKRIVKKGKWGELLNKNLNPFDEFNLFGIGEIDFKCKILGIFIETCIEDAFQQGLHKKAK